MKQARTFLRVAAVVCSLVLLAGYVYYRAAADRPAAGEHAEADENAPIEMFAGSKSAEVFEPASQPSAAPKPPASQASEAAAEFDLMMATSKSAGGGAVKPRDVESLTSSATRPSEIMPGSKVELIIKPRDVHDSPPPGATTPATQPASTNPPAREP